MCMWVVTSECRSSDSNRARAAMISEARSSSPRPSPQPSGRRRTGPCTGSNRTRVLEVIPNTASLACDGPRRYRACTCLVRHRRVAGDAAPPSRPRRPTHSTSLSVRTVPPHTLPGPGARESQRATATDTPARPSASRLILPPGRVSLPVESRRFNCVPRSPRARRPAGRQGARSRPPAAGRRDAGAGAWRYV